MEKTSDIEAKRILEALLLVSEKPLLIEQAREVLGPGFEPPEVRQLLMELSREHVQANRGVRITEVAEGFQLVTDPALAACVQKMVTKVRVVRLTRPSLETLAIVAYRQPITRVEIEQIRGVDASGVLETLMKIGFVRVTGRKEVVGRPILYGTTREFLEHFGLKNLKDLPSLEELKGVNDPTTRLRPEGPIQSSIGSASTPADSVEEA